MYYTVHDCPVPYGTGRTSNILKQVVSEIRGGFMENSYASNSSNCPFKKRPLKVSLNQCLPSILYSQTIPMVFWLNCSLSAKKLNGPSCEYTYILSGPSLYCSLFKSFSTKPSSFLC